MRPTMLQRRSSTATAIIATTASCARGGALQPRACEREGSDSARAVCVALNAADRQRGQPTQVLEFRREPGGYSILTIPAKPLGTDGDLTVHVSHGFQVTGFGPDSA